MSIIVKTKYVFLVSAGILLGLFFLGRYIGIKNERKSSTIDKNTYLEEIKRIKTTLHEKELYLTSIEQIVEKQKEAIKAGEVEKKELKVLNLKQANEISRLKLRVDTLLNNVSHTGEFVMVSDKDTVDMTAKPQNAIKLPFSFRKTDQWLNLSGDFDINGKLDISLKIDADVSVITGIDKTTKKPTCIVSTDNKYIQTIGLASYKFDTVKPNKWGIGIQIGYGVNLSNPVKASPYVGFGVSRNILRF